MSPPLLSVASPSSTGGEDVDLVAGAPCVRRSSERLDDLFESINGTVCENDARWKRRVESILGIFDFRVEVQIEVYPGNGQRSTHDK